MSEISTEATAVTATPGRAAHAAPGESSPLGLKHAMTSNRLGHALAALRELREATFGGTPAGDIVRSALADDAAIRDNVALTPEPKPAPELTALREGIAALAERLEASACATHPSRKTQIELECAAELRDLLEG